MAVLAGQTFALAAGSGEARLFRVIPGPDGIGVPEPLASFPGPPTAPATFAGLGEILAGRRGRLHVSLPLFVFETATIDLPITGHEAVARVLPYHLGKVLTRPLGDFVFDWQIVREQKGSAKVSVFLLPARMEQGLRQALAATRVRLATIEPDIFSVFAHAATLSPLPEKGSLLGLIIHDNFIVQGFYEDGRLRLVREVKLPVPEVPFEETCLLETGEIPLRRDDDILSAFALSPEQDKPVMEETPAAGCGPWREYFAQVTLETVRGRDYYAAIMKGAPPARVFLAGDGDFVAPLARSISGDGEMEATVMDLPGKGEDGRLVNAMAAGAAAGDGRRLARINVVPEPTLGQKVKRLPPFLAAALAVVLALVFTVGYLDLSRRMADGRARLATLERQAEAARILAGSRARMAGEIKRLAARRKDLAAQAKKLRTPAVTDRRYSHWLRELGRMMPVQVRCDRMEFTGNRAVFQGRAVDHAAVERFAERLRRLDRVNGLVIDEVRRNDRKVAPLDFRMTWTIRPGRRGGDG